MLPSLWRSQYLLETIAGLDVRQAEVESDSEELSVITRKRVARHGRKTAAYRQQVAALAVYSVILLFFHFFWAILLFIVGNIAARLGYEFIMMLFSMHRTLRSIDRKMPEPPPFEQPAPAPQPEPQNTPENPLPPDQP